ncbi:hypothetical protein B0H15DRAFT_943754 [Mycena belliarum]|uniref:Uncharacterized protein n=1 Tax=Mycena belliarum TaxID=1033014 RepID=A0AAD6UK39_9AGAR|nr:hypothetical protein B0H15DRAFT_943754 [Mycena belliae]
MTVQLLEAAQRARTPPYPAFTRAFLYSDLAALPQLVEVPFDYGVGDSRSPFDLDFDTWLNLIQRNVVDFAPYITTIKNPSHKWPPYFACIVGPQEPGEPSNTCISEHLALDFSGRILVVALAASRTLVAMRAEYVDDVDLAVSRAVAGSVAASLYCIDVTFGRPHRPADLNIIVPRGAFVEWREWFSSKGAIVTPMQKMLRFRTSVLNFVSVRLPLTLGEWSSITISESRSDNTLIPLFDSKLTCQMTMFTASHVLACYPELTGDLEAVVGPFLPVNFRSPMRYGLSLPLETHDT